MVDGIHPPIIDRETWDKVRAIAEERYIPSRNDGTVKSPLAGLVRCQNCGGHMQRITFPKGGPYLICPRHGCCASAKAEYVENALLISLDEILNRPIEPLPVQDEMLETRKAAIEAIRRELDAAERTKARLYELVEARAYSVTEFQQRMENVKEKINRLQKQETEAVEALESAQRADPVKQAERIRSVLDLYRTLDAAGRNALLKSIVDTVWYTKRKKTKPTDFILRIVLKGP